MSDPCAPERAHRPPLLPDRPLQEREGRRFHARDRFRFDPGAVTAIAILQIPHRFMALCLHLRRHLAGMAGMHAIIGRR
jgi:hypothetical protein